MEQAAVRAERLEVVDAASVETTTSLQELMSLGVEWLEGFKTKPEKEGDEPQPTLTYHSYKNAFRVFVQFMAGSGRTLNRETAKVNRETVKAYCEWLPNSQTSKGKTRSLSTARNYFSILLVFCKWLAGEKQYPDFTAGLHTIQHDTSTHAHDTLELDEAADVMNSFKGTDIKTVRDKAIMALLLTCGLRTMEVTRLRIEHVEGLENTRRKAVCKLALWRKKHKGFDSKVILPQETLELIKDYLALRGIDVRSKNHRPLTDEEKKQPLFVSLSRRNKNQQLTRQTISKLAKKTFRAVGVDDARVVAHSCRNFAASTALDNGCSLDEVSKMLGHKDVRTTEIYRNDQIAERNTATRTVASTLFACVREKKKKEARRNVGNR